MTTSTEALMKAMSTIPVRLQYSDIMSLNHQSEDNDNFISLGLAVAELFEALKITVIQLT